MIDPNALALAGELALGIIPLASEHNQVSVAVFRTSAADLVLAKSKRANAALLAFMALQYPVGAWLQMMGWYCPIEAALRWALGGG